MRYVVGILLMLCYLLGYQTVEFCINYQKMNRAEHDLIYQRLDYLERPKDAKE